MDGTSCFSQPCNGCGRPSGDCFSIDCWNSIVSAQVANVAPVVGASSIELPTQPFEPLQFLAEGDALAFDNINSAAAGAEAPPQLGFMDPRDLILGEDRHPVLVPSPPVPVYGGMPAPVTPPASERRGSPRGLFPGVAGPPRLPNGGRSGLASPPFEDGTQILTEVGPPASQVFGALMAPVNNHPLAMGGQRFPGSVQHAQPAVPQQQPATTAGASLTPAQKDEQLLQAAYADRGQKKRGRPLGSGDKNTRAPKGTRAAERQLNLVEGQPRKPGRPAGSGDKARAVGGRRAPVGQGKNFFKSSMAKKMREEAEKRAQEPRDVVETTVSREEKLDESTWDFQEALENFNVSCT